MLGPHAGPGEMGKTQGGMLDTGRCPTKGDNLPSRPPATDETCRGDKWKYWNAIFKLFWFLLSQVCIPRSRPLVTHGLFEPSVTLVELGEPLAQLLCSQRAAAPDWSLELMPLQHPGLRGQAVWSDGQVPRASCNMAMGNLQQVWGPLGGLFEGLGMLFSQLFYKIPDPQNVHRYPQKMRSMF